MAIAKVEQLREHLELAIAIELSTVPPYLYAMYSIADQSSDAALLIRSVVAEEMLHAALAANLLLAIGGEPDFSSKSLIPTYPSDLPHHRPTLTLDLKPCTRRQVHDLFLVIEQPEMHSAMPGDDTYESLGQFYHAIELGMAAAAAETDIFSNPQLERQMAKHKYYSPVALDAEDSGGLSAIDSIEAADDAIQVIIHQGEGVSDEKWADPLHQELTHYYKFLRIANGDAPIGDVAPVPTNPRARDYPDPVRSTAELFNAAYRYLFLIMHDIFQPDSDRDRDVGRLYTVMSAVLSPLAHHLVSTPLGGGLVAAPTFEVYEFAGADALVELAGLAKKVAEEVPALSSVAATINDV